MHAGSVVFVGSAISATDATACVAVSIAAFTAAAATVTNAAAAAAAVAADAILYFSLCIILYLFGMLTTFSSWISVLL